MKDTDKNKDKNKDKDRKGTRRRKRLGRINKLSPGDISKAHHHIRPKLKKKRRNSHNKKSQKRKKTIRRSTKSTRGSTKSIRGSKKRSKSITKFEKYWYPEANPRRSKRKNKIAKSIRNDTSKKNVVWIIRHLHRLDKEEPTSWKKSDRINQNWLDSPLTDFGKQAAYQAGVEITGSTPNIQDIKYIYTSPFTRCIETSLEISKAISQHTGKIVQLRIEYGLSEAVAIHLEFLKVVNQSLSIDKVPILDFELAINQISRRYYPYIDTKYKSLYRKSDIVLETLRDSAERTVKTMRYLTNNYKNIVICSHQIPVTIANMYFYNKPYPLVYLYKINPNKDKSTDKKAKKEKIVKDGVEMLDPKRVTSYGILSGFVRDDDKWKYIYPPSNEYLKDIDL